MMEFDPRHDVPIDDEEAEIALRHGKTEVSDSLCGIYRCRRAAGATVLEAFEVALLAYIDACEKQRERKG